MYILKGIFKILKWLLIIAFWWSLFVNFPNLAVILLFGYIGYKVFVSKK